MNQQPSTPRTTQGEFAAAPTEETLVLANRPIRTDIPTHRLSRFKDDRWDFAPGIFEEHHPAISISFSKCAPEYVATLKHYAWLLINTDHPIALRRSGGASKLGLLTISSLPRRLNPFFAFLRLHGVLTLQQVRPDHYDTYLADIKSKDIPLSVREDLVTEVRRLWSYRDQLPSPDRLPDSPPWDDDYTADLVGRRPSEVENLTPRIPEPVMVSLLAWSIRFIEHFADDIIAAFSEYKQLARRNAARRPARDRPGFELVLPRAERWLADLKDRGDGLPGKRGPDGSLQIDWSHVCRMVDSQRVYVRDSEVRELIERCGLPIEDGARLSSPIVGEIEGDAWLGERISYQDAESHARRLSTACFIVIAYLTGMRVGEVLSLKRGCAEFQPATQLWLIRGIAWKAVKDETGSKNPLGIERDEPWVALPLVAKAVATLERIHDSDLLYPTLIDDGRYPTTTRAGRGRLPSHINRDLADFVDWVNSYCLTSGRRDAIPPDPEGRALSGGRFRRTLAWHIHRRPRGIVAGAIQYGHVSTQIFLGYAGNYASGFPDELALEEFLVRLEEVASNAVALEAGGRVSGPAAQVFRDRVAAAEERFAGRVLHTSQATRAMMSNPDLQVFPGHGMTCVMDRRVALCELQGSPDSRRTPTLDDCRPACANIARTDSNIEELRTDAQRLRMAVDDPLAPRIRHRREALQLQKLEDIIRQHDESDGGGNTK